MHLALSFSREAFDTPLPDIRPSYTEAQSQIRLAPLTPLLIDKPRGKVFLPQPRGDCIRTRFGVSQHQLSTDSPAPHIISLPRLVGLLAVHVRVNTRVFVSVAYTRAH